MGDQGVVIICFATVTVIAIVLLALRNRNHATELDNVASIDSNEALAMPPQPLPMVLFEEAPPLEENEERRLVRIEDSRLLAEIDRVVPVVSQAAAGADAAARVCKTVEAHNKAAESAGQLYRAIIPRGAKLADSRAMEGAKRGIYHAEKGIKGHANLVSVEQQQIDPTLGKELVATNVTSSAMNVASLVVGQYYMSQINGRLESVEKGIGGIAEFQDIEYRSKVYALVAAVKKSSSFDFEVMEDNELRLRELSYLKERENECAQLLGQANIMLEQLSSKKGMSYDDYEAAVREANTWIHYQQVLLQVMSEISELTYVLNRGAVSRESSHALLLPYAAQTENSLRMLSAWHEDYELRLEIDTASSRRRRQGLEAAFYTIPALFKDDLHYRRISSRTSNMIKHQKQGPVALESDGESDLYQEDVSLVMKDGTVYYLPPAEEES